MKELISDYRVEHQFKIQKRTHKHQCACFNLNVYLNQFKVQKRTHKPVPSINVHVCIYYLNQFKVQKRTHKPVSSINVHVCIYNKLKIQMRTQKQLVSIHMWLCILTKCVCIYQLRLHGCIPIQSHEMEIFNIQILCFKVIKLVFVATLHRNTTMACMLLS